MPVRRGNSPQAISRRQVANGRPGGLDSQAIQRLAFGQAAPAPVPASQPTVVPGSTGAGDRGQAKQMEVLERRLQKLTNLLDRQERELQLVQQRVVGGESGVASEYRNVQGLSAEDDHFKQKKELMSQIFQANVDLHRQIGAGAKAS